MASGWEGLVWGDYEVVMPLIWRKKWGIAYFYQPAFFQQGGIFYHNRPSPVVTENFLKYLPSICRFAEITLNHDNDLTEVEGCKIVRRTNYILDLSAGYESIKNNYSSSLKRNLGRIRDAEHQYLIEKDPQTVVALYQQLYQQKQPAIRSSDYRNFLSICQVLQKSDDLILRSAIDKQGELLASILLLKDDNRIYNMMSCLTPAGRNAEGNYFLYDQLIREFSGSPGLTLDFEGSDVPAIADFYGRFSPAEEKYPFIRYNHLLPPFSWLKG